MGYLEERKSNARGNGQSTDMMRHLHTRQYLGKAMVLSDNPAISLSAARKQWLKLSRYIQSQRAATLDADKILKYTHMVTHMQHMRFSSKDPLDNPEADVYFLHQDSVQDLPSKCLTIYLISPVNKAQLTGWLDKITEETLVVDYTGRDLKELGLQPKSKLEKQVKEHWQELQEFLSNYHIDVNDLSHGGTRNPEAMEEALDILLGAGTKFLQIASNFQHALELARPMRLTKSVRGQYDSASLLAHRVQALSTDGFSSQFLETYNEDDTFFLYDPSRGIAITSGESLKDAIDRHVKAGRHNLANALKRG